MPTITEVSDEVPVAVPSDGTEDVVQGHVVEQEGKSNDTDDESADDSSSSTTSDEDQSDSSSNDETSSNSDSDKSTDSSDMEFDDAYCFLVLQSLCHMPQCCLHCNERPLQLAKWHGASTPCMQPVWFDSTCAQ